MAIVNRVKVLRKTYVYDSVEHHIEKILVELMDSEVINDVIVFKVFEDINVTDMDLNEALQKVQQEAQSFYSASRERFERAKELSKRLNIPLCLVTEDGTCLLEINP